MGSGGVRSSERCGLWAGVVIDEDAKDTLEVASVQDQDPVEALGADGPHEALGRIGVRMISMPSLRKTVSKSRVN